MYKIIIEKLETKEWTENERRLIDERPYTDEELANTNHYFLSSQEKGEQSFKSVYEYVPVKKNSEKWIQVYQQVLDEIDVKKVIIAAIDS